jgi:hypothetical protein
MAGAFGDFGTLTEAFMAAAVDPTRWDAAMDAAAKATSSVGAILLPVRGRTPQFAGSPSILPAIDAYVRNGWVHRDERYRSLPIFFQRGVACDLDFTTPEEMARSAYYQEFLAPHGLRWFAGVKVGNREDVWYLSIQRSIADGPFGPTELNPSPNSPIALRAPRSLQAPSTLRASRRRSARSKRAIHLSS